MSPTPSDSARATCRGRHRRVSVPVKYKIDWMVTSNKEDRSCIGHPVLEIQASKHRDRTSHTDFSPIYAHSTAAIAAARNIQGGHPSKY